VTTTIKKENIAAKALKKILCRTVAQHFYSQEIQREQTV
jgi:hypothetical protein